MNLASRTFAKCLLFALLTGASLACAQKSDPPAAPAAATETPKILQGQPQGTYAYFKTSMGEFATKLFTDLAPNAVANFVGLAEGTKTFLDLNTSQAAKRPFYDGLTFHRIIDGFMIQGGDPRGDGTGGPGYKFKDEITPKLRFDRPGLLAYANSGPNTNGCQFFVTVAPQPGLDPSPRGQYTIFGEVVKGMEVVNAIDKTPTGQNDRPIKQVVIDKIRIYNVSADGKTAEAKTADAKTSGTASK